MTQLVEHWPGTLLRQVRFPSGARDVSPSQLSVQTLLQCLYSPHVQQHALTSVRTSKTANIGSHTLVWTHENPAHTVRNG